MTRVKRLEYKVTEVGPFVDETQEEIEIVSNETEKDSIVKTVYEYPTK